MPNYRLPSEYEWLIAASNHIGSNAPELSCDTFIQKENSAIYLSLKNKKKSGKYSSKIFGLNNLVYEWLDEDYFAKPTLLDYNHSPLYYKEQFPVAVIRKSVNCSAKSDCCREGRLRDGQFLIRVLELSRLTLEYQQGLIFRVYSFLSLSSGNI